MPKASFFLVITPSEGDPIKGEAEEADFEGTIEVTSWDWSVSDKTAKDMMTSSSATSTTGTGTAGGGTATSTTSSGGGGARHGQAGEQSTQPAPVRFSKASDRSTTRLLNAMYRDEKFDEARFILRSRWRVGTGGSEAEQEFRLDLVLEKARIISYDFNARSQNLDVELDEEWEMTYDQLYYEYVSGPGLNGQITSVPFGPPDQSTKAAQRPHVTDEERNRSIRELEAELARLRREGGGRRS